jgi:hypothetical protein
VGEAAPAHHVTIIKKELQLDASLHTLLQILSVTLFERMPLQRAFADSADLTVGPDFANQLTRFDS